MWTLTDCQLAVEILGAVVIFIGVVLAIVIFKVGQLLDAAPRSTGETESQ